MPGGSSGGDVQFHCHWHIGAWQARHGAAGEPCSMLTSLLVSGGKSYTIPVWNMKTMKSFENSHLFWEWDDLILDGRVV